jgi:hypothetical protein
MIFRRKTPPRPPAGAPVMRSREGVENKENPLARRFRPDDEPDTIDLAQPARFPEEPGTADLSARKSDSERLPVISLVPETGKLYVQPGSGDQMIHLAGEPVRSATELRPGDRVRLQGLELVISRIPQED